MWLNGLDVEMLLAVMCWKLKVTLKKLLTYHARAGPGILGVKWFGTANAVRYYYRSLVYENMTQPE